MTPGVVLFPQVPPSSMKPRIRRRLISKDEGMNNSGLVFELGVHAVFSELNGQNEELPRQILLVQFFNPFALFYASSYFSTKRDSVLTFARPANLPAESYERCA